MTPGRPSTLGIGREHPRRGDLALALHDRIDRAVAVPQDLLGDERDAVPAEEDERAAGTIASASFARSIASGTLAR